MGPKTSLDLCVASWWEVLFEVDPILCTSDRQFISALAEDGGIRLLKAAFDLLRLLSRT